MSTFSEVENGVYRWDGVDADHGFPIVGYVVSNGDGNLLIDPPGTSGSAGEIKAFGKPQAILITGPSHVRGAGQWKAELGIPIAAPATAADELAEARTSGDQALDEGDEYLGWKVLRFTAGQGDASYDELVFWQAERRIAVIGDFFTAAEDGGVGFGPHLFLETPIADLRPLLDRLVGLDPRLILSSHLGPRKDVRELLQSLKSA